MNRIRRRPRIRLGRFARGALALALLVASIGCGRVLALTYPPLTVQAGTPAPPPPPPKVELIEIKDRVEFEVNKAKLLKASFAVIDQVVEVMKKNTDIALVEVQGHTDTSGDATKNLSLSQQRADAVRDYMINKGKIDGERLQAKGFGQEKPIADNSTAEGKQKNRRVEFHILKRTPK
jgi:outer membrane protein OmpA-like peptidoglycan-associated protein